MIMESETGYMLSQSSEALASGDHKVLVATDIALFTIKDGFSKCFLLNGTFLPS